jgi:surface antigen
VAVVAFVSQKPTGTASNALLNQQSNAAAANPLDQLSSADIAVHISRLVQMNQDEVVQVTNQADSENAQLAIAQADDVVVAKPQLLSTDTKSAKDIEEYTVAAGDTVESLAVKFGVTSDSIKWSNGLSSNSLQVGKKLSIPPVNGVVYTVKPGDTVESIASRFAASAENIIADNDSEVSGLRTGQQILIRDGVQQAVVRATARVSVPVLGFSYYNGGANSYVRGYCTWYAANRAGVPGGWGNANTWDNRAPFSGWTVSTVPRVGAVGQTDAGYAGHVGIVEAVSEDGTMIKYSDMNGIAGYNRVGYSDWVSVHSVFQRFIFH